MGAFATWLSEITPRFNRTNGRIVATFFKMNEFMFLVKNETKIKIEW